MPVVERGHAASRFALMLDGAHSGFIKSVDGGGVTAEVIHEANSPSYFVKKHIGPPQYEDFILDVDFSMSKLLFDWVAAAWAGNSKRQNGAIISSDSDFKAIHTQEFFNALLTEFTIPACDGASKKPGYFTIKFVPEYTRNQKGDGSKIPSAAKKSPKQWTPANFQLTIDGLDCKRVMKVDSLTVKQGAVSDEIGDMRDHQKEPGKIEFPNLKITLPESAAQSWTDWFEDFVIKGNNDESKEKNGSLVFFAANAKDTLATINFFNLGIFRLSRNKAEANTDQVQSVTAELYCEQMEFVLNDVKA
jgi:hypothetical protein